MKKLIPLSDFVLEQLEIQQSTSEFKEVVKNYTHFLKQPLALGMFVPCYQDGSVLKEPKAEDYFNTKIPTNELTKEDADGLNRHYADLVIFENAKEKVLFKGFELIEDNLKKDGLGFCSLESFPLIDMEDMIRWDEDIELTPSALDAIGIKE
ncbi:hypothetical protein [Chryseobacterium bernardetii]|uniref:hypothetical protein n=1 Tax=Chryseobacterium bernardetii TaxID=1241978 RepID=UPI001626B4C6|nr:hypothetical protein [Chryseobacterium bernardetii]